MILALLDSRVQLFLYPALLEKVGQHIFEPFPFAMKRPGYLFKRDGILLEKIKNFFLTRVGERIFIYIIIYMIYVPKSVPGGVGRSVPESVGNAGFVGF